MGTITEIFYMINEKQCFVYLHIVINQRYDMEVQK